MKKDREIVKEEIVDSFVDGMMKKIDDYEIGFFTKIWWRIYHYVTDFRYWVKCLYQKITTGFKHEEAWSFYSYHSEWALPRLKHLRENLHGHPCNLTFEEWQEVLDKIIWSFENINNEPFPILPDDYDERQRMITYDDGSIGFEKLDDRGFDWSNVEEFRKRMQEGLDLFAKYYLGLWD